MLKSILPFLLTFIYLIVNLITINSYGVTWDYTYHFNAGLWHLGLPVTVNNFVMLSWGPLSNLPSTLTYLFFFQKWHLLPWDAAYNLYGVVMGTLGVGVIYFFAKRLFGSKVALYSMLTLALTPRYFGHLHNNMKDIPQAVFFTLALFLFWNLIKAPTIKNLILATAVFALAFNTKFNAVFVILIGAIWLYIKDRGKVIKRTNIPVLLFFITAPVASLCLWSFFWMDPWIRLSAMFSSVSTTTTNMPVLYYGDIYRSGVNIPWHYPLGMFAATTPTPIIIFFIIGLVFCITSIRKNPHCLFLLLWFTVPLLRFLLPRIIVVDDIRHFMEVIFPLTVISALGFSETIALITNKSRISIFLSFFYFSYLTCQLISLHPYQTSYFSEWLGGTKGAQGNFDIEFWASSYKQAMQYLNKNAPFKSKIIVAMAPDIAKLYLRQDLTEALNEENMADKSDKIYFQSDYTVVLNRQSFFDWYSLRYYMTNSKPIYLLEKNTVPLVYIYKNENKD